MFSGLAWKLFCVIISDVLNHMTHDYMYDVLVYLQKAFSLPGNNSYN